MSSRSWLDCLAQAAVEDVLQRSSFETAPVLRRLSGSAETRGIRGKQRISGREIISVFRQESAAKCFFKPLEFRSLTRRSAASLRNFVCRIVQNYSHTLMIQIAARASLTKVNRSNTACAGGPAFHLETTWTLKTQQLVISRASRVTQLRVAMPGGTATLDWVPSKP